MTTIIVKENKGKVTIGYDSLCTGHDKFELEKEKVFVNSNGIIFGVAGRLLYNPELEHAQLPSPPKDPNLTDKYVTAVLMPHLRRVLDNATPRRGGHDEFEMQIIAIINNRVYEIGCDTSWMRRTDGIYAIGSGSPFARGALAHGASLEDALKIAASNDPYTGGRLTITTAEHMLHEKIST